MRQPKLTNKKRKEFVPRDEYTDDKGRFHPKQVRAEARRMQKNDKKGPPPPAAGYFESLGLEGERKWWVMGIIGAVVVVWLSQKAR